MNGLTKTSFGYQVIKNDEVIAEINITKDVLDGLWTLYRPNICKCVGTFSGYLNHDGIKVLTFAVKNMLNPKKFD